MDKSDIIGLGIGYASCIFMTWVGIWSIANHAPTAFDFAGFIKYLGGLI